MPGGTFNVIFEGVTPSPAREVAARTIGMLNPHRLYMPAAGRFGATEAAIKAGMDPTRVFCSDISLFSSIVGYLADPSKDISELGLSFTGRAHSFVPESAVRNPVELGAAAMVAIKFEQAQAKHAYGQSLRRELWARRGAYVARIAKELEELVAGLGPINYEVADLTEVFARHRDDKDTVIYCNPPGYGAKAYDRMFAATGVDWQLGIVPSRPWDKAALALLYDDMTDAKATALLYSINAEFVPDSWDRILAVHRKDDRTDYLVSNHAIPVTASVTQQTQTATGDPTKYEVYNEQEITPESSIDFIEIDRPTAMYYRDLFVHRLGTTQSEWYVAMLIDQRLVTVIGLNRQRFMHFKSGYVKETFGISVTSRRYKRLGALFMECLTTTAFRDWMRLHGRYGIREMKGIETTSLTKHPESKTDRALMRLVSREKLPNGMFKLQYQGDLRDESFNDVLARWLVRQSHHDRAKTGGDVAQPTGRRSRRRQAEPAQTDA